MADELDVEEMLEAPFRKDEAPNYHDNNGEGAEPPPPPEVEERRKKHKKKKSHRSRSRSRSRSKSPRRRSHSKSPRRRSHSKSPRRRSRSKSPRRRRRSRSRSKERDANYMSRDRHRRSPPRYRDRRERRRSRSRSPLYRNRRSPPYGGGFGGGFRGGFRGARSGQLIAAKKLHSPDPDPPSEDRDRRTVMCMQLSAKVGPGELEEFFQKVGQVCEVKMISDRNSRRSKGIAYVEFHDEKSVPLAMGLTGQKLHGVPLIVQPTMAEKNRLAAQAQNLKKAEGPRKLYVGSLHYNINEAMLKAVFEPFGIIEKIQIQREDAGVSKGYGFVEYKDSESAERAMNNLNGFELAGRPMKVNHVTERDTSGAGGGGGAMEMLDGEDTDVGVGMTPQSRASLMAKLAEGHNAGLLAPKLPQVSQVPQLPVTTPTIGPQVIPQLAVSLPAISNCFMLSNMFDPSADNEPGWDTEIRDDVLDECSRFGTVLHIHVDPYSQGNVFVKCALPQVAAAAFNNLNGRFFAGKKVIAQFMLEENYHMKFPMAMAANTPLQPST